jgi:chromosome segregation ATPase
MDGNDSRKGRGGCVTSSELDRHLACALVSALISFVGLLRAQSKPDARDTARIEALEGEIANATSELEDLQKKSSKVENAIKELEQKILEIGGSRLLKQRSTVDGIKLHINLANDEITKAEVAKAKAEKDVLKLTSTIAGNAGAVAGADKEVKELEGQLAEVNEYLEELKEKVEAAQVAAENSKDDLDKLKTQLEEKREEIQEFRKKEVRRLYCRREHSEIFFASDGVVAEVERRQERVGFERGEVATLADRA